MADSPIQLSSSFLYQSYFDVNAAEAAVLNQGSGQLVVNTRATPAQEYEASGYGVGLDPTSETPVAVEFKSPRGSGSASVLLRPGQVIFPFGREKGEEFAGFRWGLPYGWLGGGRAYLTVLRSPHAELGWNPRAMPLVFHRQTIPVNIAGANLTIIEASTAHNPNWPLRFPNPGTQRYTAAGPLSQASQPVLTVEPTSVLLRLRSVLVDPTAAVLTLPSTVRFLFYGTDQFDLASDGTVIMSGVGFQDVTFPSYSKGGTNGVHQMPVEIRTDGLFTQSALNPATPGLNNLGVIAVSMGDGDDLLTNWAVDIVRYGKL